MSTRNRRNMNRYYQVWELRQKDLTFKEIGRVMGFSAGRAKVLSDHVDFIIRERPYNASNALKSIASKYGTVLL